MLTLKLVQEKPVPAPYAEAAYTVMQGRTYYLAREQTPVPTPANGVPELGAWRTRIELERDNGESVMIHIGNDEMWQKVYVMNDAGKTIDVIA